MSCSFVCFIFIFSCLVSRIRDLCYDCLDADTRILVSLSSLSLSFYHSNGDMMGVVVSMSLMINRILIQYTSVQDDDDPCKGLL